MTAALASGAVAGLGLVLVLSAIFPARPSLAAALARLQPPAAPVEQPGHQPGGLAARLGRPLVPLLAAAGLPRPGLVADLDLCGRSPQRHAAEQATAILAGLLTPYAVAALAWAGGVSLGWAMPVWACLVAAVGGGLLVDTRVRRQAASRRAQLRDSLSVHLDLTMMGLAGGAGIEQAVTDAAAIGDGWANEQLRHALHTARLTRQPVWDSLDQLGRRTRVPELSELAAAVTLAGQEGAKIRATLAARAAALRARQLAQAETSATAATERMVLPTALLFAAFLLTILYPAVSTVLTSL